MARHDQEYWFRVLEVEHIYDGDTYRLLLDLGFGMRASVKIRLHGWSCPERREPRGIEATVFVAEWFAAVDVSTLRVCTFAREKSFDRWLGDIFDADGVHLGQRLADAGLAVAFHP